MHNGGAHRGVLSAHLQCCSFVYTIFLQEATTVVAATDTIRIQDMVAAATIEVPLVVVAAVDIVETPAAVAMIEIRAAVAMIGIMAAVAMIVVHRTVAVTEATVEIEEDTPTSDTVINQCKEDTHQEDVEEDTTDVEHIVNGVSLCVPAAAVEVLLNL